MVDSMLALICPERYCCWVVSRGREDDVLERGDEGLR